MGGLFEPELVRLIVGVGLDPRAWPGVAERVHAMIHRTGPNHRVLAVLAQFGAEVSGLAGDAGVCWGYVDRAVTCGLFDLHWLDRCPLLACIRTLPAYAGLRAIVEERAHSILDALYCDRTIAT